MGWLLARRVYFLPVATWRAAVKFQVMAVAEVDREGGLFQRVPATVVVGPPLSAATGGFFIIVL